MPAIPMFRIAEKPHAEASLGVEGSSICSRQSAMIGNTKQSEMRNSRPFLNTGANCARLRVRRRPRAYSVNRATVGATEAKSVSLSTSSDENADMRNR
jgi:hypothetical protein